MTTMSVPLRRLGAHAFALLLLFVLVQGTIGSGIWTVDEGAYLMQSKWVQDGYWTEEIPDSSLGGTADEPIVALPVDNGTVIDGDRWAPYVRHPAFPALLAVGAGVAGSWGAPLVTIFAAVAACFLVGASVRSHHVGALWLCGVATPLFFHAQVVWAHAVGVAAAALAVHGIVRLSRSPGLPLSALAEAAIGVFIIQVFRTEGLLFGVAAVLALTYEWLRSERSWQRLAIPASVGIGLVAGFVVDTLWRASALEGKLVAGATTDLGRITPGERVFAFFSATMAFGQPQGAALLRLGVLVLVIVGGFAVRRGQDLTRWALPLVALIGVLAYFDSPENTGLLIAAPLVTFGVIAATTEGSDLTLLRMTALYWVGVAATVYSPTAGADFGGRLLLLSLPALVVVGAVPVAELVKAHGQTAALAVAALVMAQGYGIWQTLNDGHSASRTMTEEVAQFAAAHPGAVLVSPEIRTGRVAWDEHPIGLATTTEDSTGPFLDAHRAGDVWLIGAGFGSEWLATQIPEGWEQVDEFEASLVSAIKIESER